MEVYYNPIRPNTWSEAAEREEGSQKSHQGAGFYKSPIRGEARLQSAMRRITVFRIERKEKAFERCVEKYRQGVLRRSKLMSAEVCRGRSPPKEKK